MITVAYQGRPQLDRCRHALAAEAGVAVVPLGVPCDLGVSIGGSHIYTPEEIDATRCGIVNLHFAPLPAYRGRYSAGHALRNGETMFGATLHYVDAGIDTGPIIATRPFRIRSWDTVDSLRARAFEAGVALFVGLVPELVDAARHGWMLPAVEQDESRARYYDRASLALLR